MPKKLYSRVNCQFKNWEAHKRVLEREKIAEALKNEERLLSVYHSDVKGKFYIITEGDRSVTTVLFPREY